MTMNERFAKGSAILESLPVTNGVLFKDIKDHFRDAGILEVDVESWEHQLAFAILEKHNETTHYPVILKHEPK